MGFSLFLLAIFCYGSQKWYQTTGNEKRKAFWAVGINDTGANLVPPGGRLYLNVFKFVLTCFLAILPLSFRSLATHNTSYDETKPY